MSVMFAKMATEMTDKWSYLSIRKFTAMSHSMRLAAIADAVQEAKG